MPTVELQWPADSERRCSFPALLLSLAHTRLISPLLHCRAPCPPLRARPVYPAHRRPSLRTAHGALQASHMREELKQQRKEAVDGLIRLKSANAARRARGEAVHRHDEEERLRAEQEIALHLKDAAQA